VAEEYVEYGACTGETSSACRLVDTVSVWSRQRYLAVAVSVSVSMGVVGVGGVTVNAAVTVLPVPMLVNRVVPLAVTVQPAGPVSARSACRTAVRPLLVKDSVTAMGFPGVAPDRSLSFRVTFGPTFAPTLLETRYITLPCAGTLAVMAPAVSVAVCDHRSRSW